MTEERLSEDIVRNYQKLYEILKEIANLGFKVEDDIDKIIIHKGYFG